MVDEYTVRIHLLRPLARLEELLSEAAGGIVSPTAVAKYGKDFGIVPRSGVGTGPWIFDHWTVGDEIVFIANKDY